MRKTLLKESKGKYLAKDILIFDDPESLKPVLSGLRWKILIELSREPNYPAKLAEKLRLHEQKVYYHIKQLRNSGLIKVVGEKEVKGATARLYGVDCNAFGVDLPGNERIIPSSFAPRIEKELLNFLEPFYPSFNGLFVVGAPDPHGPMRVSARDAHYGFQVAMFLGKYSSLPEGFCVKLDVDVIAEKELENNLILIGGPAVNLVTERVNDKMPVYFNKDNYRTELFSTKTSTKYTSERSGIIAKITNPFNENKSIIVIAGLRNEGTKAAVIALTKYTKEILKDFEKDHSWCRVVEGFDLDGDGKIDSIEVLE